MTVLPPGVAFLMRNYRADHGKWLTADPMGCPDGWNQMAYGNNRVLAGVDDFGCKWDDAEFVAYYFIQDQARPDFIDTDMMGLTDDVWNIIATTGLPMFVAAVESYIESKTPGWYSYPITRSFGIDCGKICFAMGGGSVLFTAIMEEMVFDAVRSDGTLRTYDAVGSVMCTYPDAFRDPMDIYNWVEEDYEIWGGRPYTYGHEWNINLQFHKERILE